MENYKDDILKTRIGCLGGSDATMLAQIDKLGVVPRSAYKRLALCKGLIEPDNITTKAMLYGDFVEQNVFEYLKSMRKGIKSNPCLVSKQYSRKNVKCIDHVDIVDKDEKNRVLKLYECKATKGSVEETKEKYRAQLYHHHLLGRELAATLGRTWKVKVFLVHYNTNGINMDDEFQFDPDRITISQVRFNGSFFNMHHAMDIVDEYLENLTEYYEGDVISAEYLPEEIKSRFGSIATCMKEIKEREAKVEEFKQKLYEFFMSKGIKKVDVDGCTFTLVEPTTSTTFNSKSFLTDYEQSHPRLYKQLCDKYNRVSNKKGYVKITEKEDK